MKKENKKFKNEMRLKNINNIEKFDDDIDDNESTKSLEKIKKEKEKEILLKDEDENNIKEHFETLLTNCDKNRISTTEQLLKENPSKIKNEDLIYYLRCKLNNSNLDDTNKTKTDTYLKNISNNFKFENIFVNQTNYSSLVFAGVCLLLPFYFNYPRVYEMGFYGIFIGLIGMSSLTQNVQKYAAFQNVNFSNKSLFKNLHLKLLFFSLLFYLVFFVYICKLNHISLFFISYFVIYLCMSYVLKLVLNSPSDDNIFTKFKASFQKNNDASKLYSNIDTACKELNTRYQLEFPNTQMLYNYLSFVDLQKNKDKNIMEFISYLFQPIVTFGVLYLTGNFLNSYVNKEFDIQTVPVIGLNNDTLAFLQCQANYVLPDFLNYNKKIIEILEKFCFDKDLERRMVKFLGKVGEAYINRYRPSFYYECSKDELNVQMNLNPNFEDYREEIEDKKNYLLKENDEIIQQNKPLINQIFTTFCQEYEDSLKRAQNCIVSYNNNVIFNENQDETASLSTKVLQILIGLLSTWLIVAKFLGSGWFLSKYIMSYFGSFANVLETYKRNWIPWKLSTLGIDTLVFDNYLKNSEIDLTNNGNSVMQWVGQFLLWIFVAIPFLTTLTQAIFGYSFSPKYINIIWGLLVIVNMFGNIGFYKKEYSTTDVSLTTWNTGYIIVSIIIMLAITVGIMMNKK